MPSLTKSTPRKLPTQARAQETVEAILAATKRLLVRDGYEKTTTNRVAEVAGVSIGSLYQYFPSKQALVTALIERHLASMLEVLASTYRESNATMTLEETARSVIRAAFAAHRVNPKLHRVLLEQMARGGTLDQIAGFEDQAQRLVQSFLENHTHELRPKNIKLAARVALLAVRGTTLWTVLRSPEQLADTEFIDEISDMIVRYLVA